MPTKTKPAQQPIASLVKNYWVLKGCPRCQGDLYVGQDADGWHQSCLQCGYRRPLSLSERKQ